MIKETKFNGLTQSPSDNECTDGDLATCLNLIPEDGALKPIQQPEIVPKYKKSNDGSLIPDGAFSLPDDTYSIEFIHKVTHDEEIHFHYIIHQLDKSNDIDKWYWTERYGDGTLNEFSLDGFKVNSVSSVGNILCFVGDMKTMYSYWKRLDSQYLIFDTSILNYEINIKSDFKYFNNTLSGEPIDACARTTIEETDFNKAFPAPYSWSHDNYNRISNDAANIVFSSLDAYINKKIIELGKNYFKYYSLCVLAYRLYDNNYINITTPILLTPYIIPNRFLLRANKRELMMDYSLTTYNFSIKTNIPTGLEDIVSGVDVFLSMPESFIDFEKTPFYIDRRDCPIYNEEMVNDIAAIAFINKDKDKIYKTIDNMSFYLAKSIDKSKLGESFDLENISGTEKTITLADLYRANYGGISSINYNNRLHILQVKKSINNNYKDSVLFSFNRYANAERIKAGVTNCLFIGNTLPDAIDNTTKEIEQVHLKAIFQIDFEDKNTIFFQGNISYPFPPLIAFPSNNAIKLTIRFLYKGVWYRKCELPLHKSETMDLSYYVNVGDITANSNPPDFSNPLPEREDNHLYHLWDTNIPNYLSCYSYDLYKRHYIASGHFDDSKPNEYDYYEWNLISPHGNPLFTDITKEEYDECLAKCNDIQYISYQPSLVKVSEAENPLVFPAANSVQVGSSIVNALAANTRPISEGQFGEAPLYAFTDEGVWVLMTGANGTYEARQPVNREICSNPKGILQIDDAVLFPTERGIVMQQGRSSQLITEPLDGQPFQFLEMFKENVQKKVIAVNGTPASDITYIPFREFMKNADMVYDYYSSRIIVFNPYQSYAYVYSIKSGMWGMMHSNLKKRVNIYPEAYAINKDNNIVDLYQSQPVDDVPYFLCTRPVGFDSPETFKTAFAAIVRGYFRNERGKCGMVLYGSNDKFHYHAISSSVNHYLRGMAGSPYKYFRLALIGSLSPEESLSGFSADIKERWNNKLR